MSSELKLLRRPTARRVAELEILGASYTVDRVRGARLSYFLYSYSRKIIMQAQLARTEQNRVYELTVMLL